MDFVAPAVDVNNADDCVHTAELLRALIEHVSDIVTVLGPEARMVYQSPSIAQVLGWKPEYMIGKCALDFVHPDDVAAVGAKFVEAISHPGVTLAPHFRFRHRDGSYRWIEAIGNNLTAEPHVRGLVVISRDITERVQMEQELLQARKMEAVGRLAGGVAHDFNNLLQVIIGNCSLALSDANAERARSRVDQSLRAAQRAASLTRQLLAFGRKQTLQLEDLEIDKLVGEVVEMLPRVLEENICVRTNLQAGPARVRVDSSQLHQVLLNLAINARDAMPKGGDLHFETTIASYDELECTVRNTLSRAHSYLRLTVRDSGAGMDAATLTRIFEPFFTTKSAGDGTGLGLATVYGIVKQSGGHIEVQSRPGKGTAFQVYLPAVDAVSDGKEAKSEPKKQLRSGQCVLVVEDQEQVRALVSGTVARLGYRVLEAASGEEALRVSEAHGEPIHLLITDIVMPGMRGTELASRLKKIHAGMKVILMSGYAETLVSDDPQLLPASVFLPKPFELEKLVEAIDSVFRPSGLARTA